MKKIFVVLAIILGLGVFIKDEAWALIVGDEITIEDTQPVIPLSKLQLGVAADFIRDKKFKPDTGSEKMPYNGDRLLLKVTFSPFENVNIYLKGGIGEDTLSDSHNDLKIKSEVGPAFGGGLRVNLKKWDDINMRLGLDAQFLRFDTGIEKVTISHTDYTSVSGDFTVNQWQVACFIAKEFFQVTGYAGVDYAGSTVKYEYDTTGQKGTNKGENDNILGLLAGINIPVTNEGVIFVEGHLIDEASISLGLNTRF